ncbi:MAG: ATP-dependent RecD-like DNA helicase [Clostridia bacterium]|nr:ATP-dependent RecD-like DNA helicase [Clostridia bacterium]
MEIEGIVESIKFRNEENGYTVALFSTAEDDINIVGKFLNINVGENLKLFGELTASKYGEQFSVQKYETVEPKTKRGIIRYLASGLIKGVGPVTAKAIVDKYGLDSLEIIEFNPEKLLSIRGISKKKADVISDSFLDVREMQNAMIFLQSYNISSNLAMKIYNFYRNATIDIVKKNPYQLVEDITGVGFISADRIAMSMGISKDSQFRIRAGILYLLDEASEKNGNTFMYRAQLDQMLAKLLELDSEKCSSISVKVYDILVKGNVIKLFWRDKKEIVASTKMYNTEKSVGSKLALLNASCINIDLDVSDEINQYELKNKLKLHTDQKKAIQTAVNSGFSVITGGPGTGKTTILSCLLDIFNMQNKKILLMAPTGRAARRLTETTGYQASTIHRALEINFKQESGMFVYNERNPLPTDIVIVDEVSMVDISLMNNLLKAIPKSAKLILVGDKDQLPSVGPGNVLADILSSEIVPVSELTQIYRQGDDSLIISNAHLINQSVMPIIDNKSNDFFYEQKDNNSETFNTIIDLAIRRVPNYYNNIDTMRLQILSPLKAGVCGVENLNRELQDKLNPAGFNKKELKIGLTILREGDKVMQIANNYNLTWKRKAEGSDYEEEGKGIFNGDIGYILAIDIQAGEVKVKFEDGRVVMYPRSELGQINLAYAITIHKSQGSEFDIVIIPIFPGPPLILTKNLIYTAVTRAKKMVILVGDKTALERMVKNKHTAKRYTLLKEFIVEESQKMKKLFD